MVFEHFALNVNDIHFVVKWYIDNLGLVVVDQQEKPPFMTFLADSSERVVLELYHRPDELISNFKAQHPLTFHVAFVSEKAEEDKCRLLDKGASFVEEVVKNDGSLLVMLRDPWGMPLQLCQRAVAF
ncbi:VOC family protein [Maribacter sp. HTCC2170]|uniref:VOC family protein n=1 Tax=Maribacter sp. (strain HTCC2170 / KCCM 42371) TaxID=313603 RepID=UPI00006BD216|nr:VOC family protein [Maribacter sp. HTCC2170]EAR02456.1 seryl-tRNA synthetase [Maribacter sp. HTCC2170]